MMRFTTLISRYEQNGRVVSNTRNDEQAWGLINRNAAVHAKTLGNSSEKIFAKPEHALEVSIVHGIMATYSAIRWHMKFRDDLSEMFWASKHLEKCSELAVEIINNRFNRRDPFQTGDLAVALNTYYCGYGRNICEECKDIGSHGITGLSSHSHTSKSGQPYAMPGFLSPARNLSFPEGAYDDIFPEKTFPRPMRGRHKGGLTRTQQWCIAYLWGWSKAKNILANIDNMCDLGRI